MRGKRKYPICTDIMLAESGNNLNSETLIESLKKYIVFNSLHPPHFED